MEGVELTRGYAAAKKARRKIMQHLGLPSAMWALYKKSFRLHLEEDLQCSPESAAKTTGKAKAEYKTIIARLPESEKAGRALAPGSLEDSISCKKADSIDFYPHTRYTF